MRALAREPAERFPDAGAFAEALRVWRRNPDAVPGRSRGARAAVAATPAAGEPTVYVPPRVTTPGRPRAGRAAAIAGPQDAPGRRASRGGCGCSRCSA